MPDSKTILGQLETLLETEEKAHANEALTRKAVIERLKVQLESEALERSEKLLEIKEATLTSRAESAEKRTSEVLTTNQALTNQLNAAQIKVVMTKTKMEKQKTAHDEQMAKMRAELDEMDKNCKVLRAAISKTTINLSSDEIKEALSVEGPPAKRAKLA